MANEKPFKLDMSFEEALKRLGRADPRELPENVKLRQSDKPRRTRKKATGPERIPGPSDKAPTS